MDSSSINQAVPLQTIALLRQTQQRLAEASRPEVPGADRVEISSFARQLSELEQVKGVRSDLVENIRKQIQAGTYETPAKLDLAIDTLVEELFTPTF